MDFDHAEGTSMTPTEEATYALDNRVDRERLSKEERVEHDRLFARALSPGKATAALVDTGESTTSRSDVES
jgi:hypothetical protein